MTVQAIKKEIEHLPRQEQADIARFILDLLAPEEDFELTPELRAEIDASYESIESGEDQGYTHEAYRTEMNNFLSRFNKS